MCQICQAVARAPHQVTCCGRVYCETCLDKYRRRSSNCPNCRKRGQDFPDTRGELMERHATYLTIFLYLISPPIGDREIKSLKVVCSNGESGCGWVGELRSLNKHLTTCEYALLRCTNKCMANNEEVHVLRRDLDQHLKSKCPNRQYQCRQCKATGRYCVITTTHLDTCPNMKIPCPNNECKVSVLRCNLSKHRSKCPFEEIPCKYAGIGCEKELPRKDLVQHENDDSFHLHLAIETINELQVKERSCIFKMPGFSQHKSSSQEWYSPPFYTHPGGYKMCIMVNANGDGTHVAVFACLMKGRNDDNLPWPFTGEVTITLLNQLEDKNHHTDAVTFPHASNASKRVVNSDKVSNGYGKPEFISHDKLTAKNYQYLKDDSLFFRIKVQAAKPVKPWLTCTV